MDHDAQSDDSSGSSTRSDDSIFDAPETASHAAGTTGHGDASEHHRTTANLHEDEVAQNNPDDEVETDGVRNALAALNRHSLYIIQAFQAFIFLALSLAEQNPAQGSPEWMQAYLAWRNAYRLYNTAMVLFHGRGNVAAELQISEWKHHLETGDPDENEDEDENKYKVVDKPVSKGLDTTLDDEVMRFAGDATMDANNLSYRFPVHDPTVGFFEMTISNLGLPTARDVQRNQTGVHSRSAYYEAENSRDLISWATPPSQPGQELCPWNHLSRLSCGPRCRAVQRAAAGG